MMAPIKAKRRVALTGTPIVNRPVEMWPVIHSLDPEGFPSFMGFAKRYCAAEHNGYGWNFGGSSNTQELQDRLRSRIMVRRLKAEVLAELPAKRRQIVELTPDAECRAAIEAERAALRRNGVDPDEPRNAAVRLASGKVDFAECSRLRQHLALRKIPLCIEFIVEAIEQGSKPIIFAHHVDVVRAVVAELGALGHHPVSIVGGDAPVHRQAAVDRFQNDPDCRAIVGTIGAMGVGLTLTASSHVIFVELDWTPGAMSQAEDRAHRIGQRSSVLVQHLVLTGSVIDGNMAHMLIAKQAVIDAALDIVDDEARAIMAEIETLAVAPTASFAELCASIEKGSPEALRSAREAAQSQDRKRAKVDAAGERRNGRAVIEALAEKITAEQIEAVHRGCRFLVDMDPDRARELNGIGFSASDGGLGHALATLDELSPMEAVIGRFMLRKYRGQLGEGAILAMGA